MDSILPEGDHHHRQHHTKRIKTKSHVHLTPSNLNSLRSPSQLLRPAPPPVLGSFRAAAASCNWGTSCETTRASAARCGALWTSCLDTSTLAPVVSRSKRTPSPACAGGVLLSCKLRRLNRWCLSRWCLRRCLCWWCLRRRRLK